MYQILFLDKWWLTSKNTTQTQKHLRKLQNSSVVYKHGGGKLPFLYLVMVHFDPPLNQRRAWGQFHITTFFHGPVSARSSRGVPSPAVMSCIYGTASQQGIAVRPWPTCDGLLTLVSVLEKSNLCLCSEISPQQKPFSTFISLCLSTLKKTTAT